MDKCEEVIYIEQGNVRLDIMYREYASRLQYLALCRTGNIDTAQDIVHETFLKAVDHKDWLESIDTKYALMYLKATCSNLCVDYLRRSNIIHFVELEEEIMSENCMRELDENFIDIDAVMSYINMLSGVERETMVLKYISELSNKEISTMCNVPENTITQRLLRGRKKLKKILADDYY